MTSILPNGSAQSAAFALYQLDVPAVHPDIAIRCVKSIIEDKSGFVHIALTDPAISIVLFKLCRDCGIKISFDNLDFKLLVNKIPNQKLLSTFLGLKTFAIENLHSQIPIAELNKTSAARAIAAQLIAAKTRTVNSSISFLAALFADIGMLALAELFPKSLSRLLEESNGDIFTLLRLEKENLGLTHNVISRQLLQKWLMPQAVADSAWLYCSPAVHKLENLENIEIILTVRLADMLVKNAKGGGENVTVPSILSLTTQDINEITNNLGIFLAQPDINASDRQDFYTKTIRQVCTSLLENPTEQKTAEFLSTVWQTVKPASSAIGAAGLICSLICKIFNAQKACIYLDAQEQAVKTTGDKTEFLTIENTPSLKDIDFAEAETIRIKLDTFGELIVQSSENLDVSSIAPLVSQIISAKLIEEYNLSIAQTLLNDFTPPTQPQPAPLPQPLPPQQPSGQQEMPATAQALSDDDNVREIVAEIAAGAAHELNNPLTVISGRAQILQHNETDETKKTILNQITEKTEQAYEIVGQLMSYARPTHPQIRTVSPFIMINNCLEKVNAHYLSEPLDITIDDNIENLNDIEVDAEQIADAISQIIYNSLESYESGNGPVIISGNQQEPGFVKIRIQDQGCGMSEETLKKASEPFYSDKPAGRQRGMGLSLASSLLRNNGCTISIESQIDKGTTVTIRLPRSNKSEEKA